MKVLEEKLPNETFVYTPEPSVTIKQAFMLLNTYNKFKLRERKQAINNWLLELKKLETTQVENQPENQVENRVEDQPPDNQDYADVDVQIEDQVVN